MASRPIANKLAAASFTLGILGWVLYFLQWCFDLTIGLLLATVTAGSSTICAIGLDFLPFGFWLTSIVSGHVALAQIKRAGAPGRRRAVWALVLSYSGLFFSVLFFVMLIILVAYGAGVGVLEKVLPALPKQ